MAQVMMPKGGETIETPGLLGAKIENPQGDVLGAIADILPGPEGRIAFAILSYWIDDDTQRRVAIPFDALSCEEQICVLHKSRDTFDSAPGFVSEDDLAEPKLAEDIYRYFGVQPYWTEEGSQK
jgi:hypothetical protein